MRFASLAFSSHLAIGSFWRSPLLLSLSHFVYKGKWTDRQTDPRATGVSISLKGGWTVGFMGLGWYRNLLGRISYLLDRIGYLLDRIGYLLDKIGLVVVLKVNGNGHVKYLCFP
jgi:hypothetical protein